MQLACLKIRHFRMVKDYDLEGRVSPTEFQRTDEQMKGSLPVVHQSRRSWRASVSIRR